MDYGDSWISPQASDFPRSRNQFRTLDDLSFAGRDVLMFVPAHPKGEKEGEANRQ